MSDVNDGNCGSNPGNRESISEQNVEGVEEPGRKENRASSCDESRIQPGGRLFEVCRVSLYSIHHHPQHGLPYLLLDLPSFRSLFPYLFLRSTGT